MNKKVYNLAIAGTGNIGTELLKQIRELNIYNESIELKVACLCNVEQQLINIEGIDLENWRARLEKNRIPYNLNSFLKEVLATDVFVDATASEYWPEQYAKLLENGVSVVTPNKKGFSGRLDLYKRIKNLTRPLLAKERGIGYETTVGAGLPVVGTLQSLLAVGDEIQEISGIFSGTLSYLFNEYKGAQPFSQLVRDAQEAGYTEPDPRDDLDGLDVARKAVILAREMGQEISLEDINIDPPILSGGINREIPATEFMNSLKNYDSEIKNLYQQAKAENKILRFVARMTPTGISIGLEAVAADSPYAATTGTDNIFVFKTKYYSKQPLVIKGPGAGAAVTAAAVLGDILKIIFPGGLVP
jgi:bifunctional aspartokinase / homoserine dehydrogenase 1